MRLMITRHGETEENKAGVLQGHLPGVLSDLGKEQAGKLAERLSNEKIDLIISSDLARARDTAKIIAEFHPDADFVSNKKLREMNIGNSHGMPIGDVDWDNPPKDFETREEMGERVFELFDETLKNNLGKNVLFVGHGGINGALIKKIHEEELDESSYWKNQNNTCVSIFDIEESGKVKTVLLNCTEHLK